MPKSLLESLILVKKAAAKANLDVASLSKEKTDLIVHVCDEILNDQHLDAFITEAIQGGAGTSINMNMNEVIANRAAQLKNLAMGRYDVLHPNDDVNKAQSTNDVIPTAGKIATLKLSQNLLLELDIVISHFERLQETYKDVQKVGRTHLQDAVFISMGCVLGSFATVLKRDKERLILALESLKTINMGATAVGTGINTHPDYAKNVEKHMNTDGDINYIIADDLIDGTKHIDNFAYVHSILKLMAINLSKLSNDFRMMASGPRVGFSELFLPEKQPGSSIMPGKVNPVIVEMLNQVAFQVIGNDTTVNMALEAGQMELNVFEPVLFYNLFQSIELLEGAYRHLSLDVLAGLKVNEEKCAQDVKFSLASATNLIKVLPYATVSEMTKLALKENRPLKEIVVESKLLDLETIDNLLGA